MRSARVTPNTIGYPSDYNALLADAAASGALLVHQMYGTIALPTNPTNGQTLTLVINGSNIVITFVTSIGTTAGNVLIAATAALTMANLVQLLLNPTISNSTQVAIGVNTSVNVTLINYINWSASGTNLVTSSFNSSLYAPATSFSATTTVTSGTYTANTMALYVEPGVFYIAGTRVIFSGGVTPTVTAPVSHPRIDVLSINASGTLAWTTGTENTSPTAPTYPNPASNLVLCELYNVTGETILYDNANQTAAQGYIYNDVRPMQQPAMNWTGFASSLIPSAASTYDLGSSGNPWRNIYGNGAFITGLNTSRAVQSFTAGTTINASTTPLAVYMHAADGKVYPADISADESTYKFIGFVGDAQNVSSGATVNVTIGGYLAGFTSLTQNSKYYLGSSGAISSTPDTTRPLCLGLAVSTTAIFLISGQKIRYLSDTYSGTAGATHTITCGFRPRLVLGILDGSNGNASYSQFQANELAQFSLQMENSLWKLKTGQIGEMYNTLANIYQPATLGSFSDTGFSITYPSSSSSLSASVNFIVYGE